MIFSTIIRALLGRKRWMKIKKKYAPEKKGIYVIVMPDDNMAFNEAALRHIDDFLSYRKGRGVLILTTEEWVEQNARQFSDKIISVERITVRDYGYLRSYVDYYNFSEHFIIISLEGEFGRRLALAENVHGITKEDMMCIAVYIIRTWNEVEDFTHG
jgi:hypothetical protein